jgi:hypothetical protein
MDWHSVDAIVSLFVYIAGKGFEQLDRLLRERGEKK